MTSDRLQRVQELFGEALSCDPEDTAALLTEACGDDAELRKEVESLLSHHRQADTSFMRPPDPSPGRQPSDGANLTDPLVGETVVGYRVIRRISSGGMGTVYEAEQENPRRRVALKVIKAGLMSESLMRRFEHEAQILGKLEHPGIAYIFEAGTFDAGHGTQPFFAMEFVKGEPLVQYAEGQKLGTRERLDLLTRIADALHHAHQKGIIHRDIKPANILVNDAGEPKILDFGVARATDSDVQTTTLRTDIGELIGTVPYMSPEQAAGDPADLDTRSDVYALGVIAYELLGGRLPHDVQRMMIHEAVRMIREDDPPPLSSIDRVFRGDIEIIVAKALEKERERRYQTVGDFATDIRRYLDDEPIDARPPSTWYQVSKFAKRNRAFVGAVVAILVVLLAGVVGTSIGLVQAVKARRAEAEQRKLAEQRGKEAETHAAIALAVNDFLNNDLLAAVAPEEQGRGVTMRQVLETASTRIEGRFPDKPLVEAAVRMTLGNTYKSLGIYERAEPHIRRAFDIRQTELGEAHQDTSASMDSLAAILRLRGRYGEAERISVSVLETRLDTMGRDHPLTIASMTALAQVYESQGRFKEAEEWATSAFDGSVRALGDEDERTMATANSLANLCRRQGRYDQAEHLLEHVVSVRERVLNGEHPLTLESMNGLAAVYDSLGRIDDAERLYTQVMSARQRVLGEDHPLTLETKNNLATMFDDRGRFSEAEKLYSSALAAQRRELGEEHRDTLGTLSNLGLLYSRVGRLGDAEALLAEALEIRRRVLGEDHPETLASVHNMATLYARMRRYPAAESLYASLLDARRRVLGEEHPATMAALNGLASLYRLQGRFAEAQPLLAQAVAAARLALPQGHWHLGLYLLSQGLTLTKLEQYAEAESALTEAVRILTDALGEDHAHTLTAVKGMADLYSMQGRMGDVRPFVVRLIAIRRRLAERPDTRASTLNEYAWLLLTCEPTDLRDPAAALTAATKANEMTGGTNAGFLDTMALAHHLTGDTEKAREIQRQAISLLPPGESPLRSELETRLVEYGGSGKGG